MGENSGIAWTDNTFNPWMGCQRVSPACERCYAETLVVGRMGYNLDATDAKKKLRVWGPPSTSTRKRTSAATWKNPLSWDRAAKRDGVRRRVFCASLADVFEAHPDLDVMRSDLWPLIEACNGLDWQLLTKRPENILRMVPPSWLASLPGHVWIGTTVESQASAEQRIPELLKVPARVRFLSMEPLLEAVDLSQWVDPGERLTPRQTGAAPTGGFCSVMACPEEQPCPVHQRVSWVIVGGESGPGARRFDLAWARSIVRQCRDAGVPVFVKQLGAHPVDDVVHCPSHPGGVIDGCDAGCRFRRVLHERLETHDRAGADPAEWPEDLRVQEFPR